MEKIYVINPWSRVRVAIDPAEVTQEKLDGMVLERGVCEEIHREGDADTPGEFFRRYAELVGPEAAGHAWFS